MSFYGYLLTAFIIFRQDFCAAEKPSVPKAPTLTQTSVSGSSVELLCQAPQGSGGREFKLFKLRTLVDTVNHKSKLREARFVLRVEDTNKDNLYCCQYENSEISPYFSPELKTKVPVAPPPSPRLVVEPSSDYVRNRGTKGSMTAPSKLVSRSQHPLFSVKTMGREDSGEYVCLYQLTLPKTGQVNSSTSQPVHITVIDLPVPTLSLSKNDVLECVGSPSYPQASFSLFRVGSLLPEATRLFSLTEVRGKFPIPNHYDQGEQYQCQYTVQMGNSNLYSKMSLPVNLPCIKGKQCTPSSPDTSKTGKVDLVLIIGSVSAGVLFLMVVSLLSFAIHRHIKTMAERRRKREQDKLWQQIHIRDPIFDLPRQPFDCNSQDFEPAFKGRPLVPEPIYDCPSMTTFTNPALY
ncbi:uncharacterized protein [Misgurnus anguillicaudatus]|uniref:uncharacterized protein isoform X2 n=1 Tax=Misgurnus anguillicaudatus TaxID=75329 RepID=UPI003CCF907D